MGGKKKIRGAKNKAAAALAQAEAAQVEAVQREELRGILAEAASVEQTPRKNAVEAESAAMDVVWSDPASFAIELKADPTATNSTLKNARSELSRRRRMRRRLDAPVVAPVA